MMNVKQRTDVARHAVLSNSAAGTWETPEDRDFASLIDYHLYGEVLRIAAADDFVTAEKLSSAEEGLRDRLRKLFLIQKSTETKVRGLLSILARFGWLKPDEKDRQKFVTTIRGLEAASLSNSDIRRFRRLIAQRLHERYVVPGWFIDRLYRLNPERQGEIVLPAPRRAFVGERRGWKDNSWIPELDAEVLEAGRISNRLLPGSFPLAEKLWLKTVQEIWRGLASGDPPRNQRAKTHSESGKQTTFGVRGRLLHAMREAAVRLLFGATMPNTDKSDFPDGRDPIHPRSFTVWCPRLSELELIFYTDYHPLVPGKIIVPCAVFRGDTTGSEFERVGDIRDLHGRSLFLFQPQWRDIRDRFLRTLFDAYRNESKRVGAFYVSLLIVRDEVCRQLRLSADLFDALLENAYEEAIREIVVNGQLISISLESDIRPDQRSAVGLNQRPVYIQKVPQSLIAISNTTT